MHRPVCRTFRTPSVPLPLVIQEIWQHLQALDDHLPDLTTFGIGEAPGAHLHVKFARDEDHQLFGCEVVDLRAGRIWEMGFAQVSPKDWRVFWRTVAGSSEPPPCWERAAGHMEVEQAEPELQPTFSALCSAYAASGGLTLADNNLRITAQEDELSYWRELARSQARVIERFQEQPLISQLPPPSPPQITATAAAIPPARFWTLKDLGEWAALNRERIVILPRAIASARKADYQDSQTLYAALEVLAGSYRLVKLSKAPRDQAKQELDALGIGMGGSVEPAYAGEAGDGYFVRWRGRRCFLDQHLKKGTSRDPRYCLRVYFMWDEELQVCVVGWLPTHLFNSRS